MSYIKIFTIKDNVNRSIDYILNPEKTSSELIYFNKCGIYNTEQDFELTRLQFHSKVKVTARHIIQSYATNQNINKDEVLKVSKEFCDKHLKDYQYVISVHTDQEHLHAHIIFNTVNLKTGKAYRSNKKTFHDKLIKDFNTVLRENNIEECIVTEKKVNREYENEKSLRDLLKKNIDSAILKSSTYEEFIKIMSVKYSIKDEGYKYLSFKHKNFSKKFMRCTKKLGEEYTRESIKKRIENKIEYAIVNSNNKNNKKEKSKNFHQTQDKEYIDLSNKFNEIKKDIGFIVDTQSNDKARTKQGYRNWAKKNNTTTINHNIYILNKKYDIKYDFEKNINKKIKENMKKLQTTLDKNDIIKLKIETYELCKILNNIEKYNSKENIYKSIEV